MIQKIYTNVKLENRHKVDLAHKKSVQEPLILGGLFH